MGNRIGKALENMSGRPTLPANTPTSVFDTVDNFVVQPALPRINRTPRVLIAILHTVDLPRPRNTPYFTIQAERSQPATMQPLKISMTAEKRSPCQRIHRSVPRLAFVEDLETRRGCSFFLSSHGTNTGCCGCDGCCLGCVSCRTCCNSTFIC